MRPGGKVLASLTANIQPGWHLYSLTTPKGGPNPTTISLSGDSIISGVRIYQPQPIRKMDPNFQLETETFERQLPLLLEITVKDNAVIGAANLTVHVRYQCCADTTCLPPKRKVASTTLRIDPSAKPAVISIPAGYNEIDVTPSATRASHRAATPPVPLKTRTGQESLLGGSVAKIA